MEHLDHPSPHFNDAKMARFLLLRAFIIALGGEGMGDNCSILYCPRLSEDDTGVTRSYMFAMQNTSDLFVTRSIPKLKVR